jgi:hypothetical protein
MAYEYKEHDDITSKQPVPTTNEPALFPLKASLETNSLQMAANDCYGVVKKPAGFKVVDGYAYADDIDSNGTPAAVLTVAAMNADKTDIVAGKKLVAATTVGQGGGVVRMNDIGLMEDDGSTELIIGIKVDTAPATKANGTIGVVLLCVPV